ncbi:hypothetical protein WJX72_003935 [[Myrmecia] bisecta]|uniref:Uncharacterized protein n=1 Tax=[Myrmecia] bisecta TaxID=41462 RepID=A0AAW1P1V9_9CHLO
MFSLMGWYHSARRNRLGHESVTAMTKIKMYYGSRETSIRSATRSTNDASALQLPLPAPRDPDAPAELAQLTLIDTDEFDVDTAEEVQRSLREFCEADVGQEGFSDLGAGLHLDLDDHSSLTDPRCIALFAPDDQASAAPAAPAQQFEDAFEGPEVDLDSFVNEMLV